MRRPRRRRPGRKDRPVRVRPGCPGRRTMRTVVNPSSRGSWPWEAPWVEPPRRSAEWWSLWILDEFGADAPDRAHEIPLSAPTIVRAAARSRISGNAVLRSSAIRLRIARAADSRLRAPGAQEGRAAWPGPRRPRPSPSLCKPDEAGLPQERVGRTLWRSMSRLEWSHHDE
jgi:hypothetical protein